MKNEEWILKQVVDEEYQKAKSNQDMLYADFDSALDMLDLIRTDKQYEWLSDIKLPEFPAMLLTDASNWANQYFQSRDFVEVFLEGDKPADKISARAIKKLINKTLNNKDVYYFQKYMRARLINALAGYVYLKCWWDYEGDEVEDGYDMQPLDVDIMGNKFEDPTVQDRAYGKVPRMKKTHKIDRFNFDVLNPKSVFTDNTYCYSIQQKPWVTVMSEMSYNDLKGAEKKNGYINLNKLKDLIRPKAQDETETSKGTYNADDRNQKIQPASPMFDILERFGKQWVKVVSKNPQTGYPLKIEIGLDDEGLPKDSAELIECITTVAMQGNSKILIRFQPTPFIDDNGYPYKPLIRGLCYVHPTKDVGMSSAKYARELDTALSDTFNMSQDRVKLATLPVLKGRRYSLEDNSTVYFEPEHVILLDDPEHDLTEFKIRENIEGALSQIGMLKSSLNQLEAVFPSQQGMLPNRRETATAVASANNNADSRGNYKSLTVEFTLLNELYNMIIMMTNQFMQPETALDVMGEDVYSFAANADYTYSPVSSNIEQEYNKQTKLKIIDQFIGRLVNLPNPKTPVLLNKLMAMAFNLLGQEFQEIESVLLDESVPPPPTGGGQQIAGLNATPTNNQNGMPMSGAEQSVRMEAGGM